jgi:acyl-CoA synthetase (AMP-forming)/AMP-acid ligase II
VKRSIAPYKYPRAVEFVDSLPRTYTGKLQRFKLRAQPVNNVAAEVVTGKTGQPRRKRAKSGQQTRETGRRS